MEPSPAINIVTKVFLNISLLLSVLNPNRGSAPVMQRRFQFAVQGTPPLSASFYSLAADLTIRASAGAQILALCR